MMHHELLQHRSQWEKVIVDACIAAPLVNALKNEEVSVFVSNLFSLLLNVMHRKTVQVISTKNENFSILLLLDHQLHKTQTKLEAASISPQRPKATMAFSFGAPSAAAPAPSGGGLFGAPAPAPSGGLFGAPAPSGFGSTPAPAAGGLFGSGERDVVKL